MRQRSRRSTFAALLGAGLIAIGIGAGVTLLAMRSGSRQTVAPARIAGTATAPSTDAAPSASVQPAQPGIAETTRAATAIAPGSPPTPGGAATAAGAFAAVSAPTISPAASATPSTVPAWAVTTPALQPSPPPATAAATAVAGLTLEEKVGQMLMFGFDGTDAGPAIANLIQQRHVGNIVLLGDNVQTQGQLSAMNANLQRAARAANGGIGLLISIDQEGGSVQRLAPPAFAGLPSARSMAGMGPPTTVKTMATGAAAQLSRNGINMDLAPVLDVNDNPLNPVIGDRAFGTDPATVQTYGLAFMQGLAAGGVASVAKHFPGHGNTSTDSHVTLPFVTKSDAQLHAVELAPFAAAIRANVNAIMIDHVVYTAWDPDHPASLSPTIITGILRQQLGYDGVVMTDDMNMAAIADRYGSGEAAVEAVLAGVDILLTGGPLSLEATMQDAVIAAVHSGRIPLARIDQSVARILRLKHQLGLTGAGG